MEPLEIAQFAATILALVASAFLDRKIFILMNFALLTFWGIICMLFPKMLLEMHSVGKPTNWHVMTMQLLGLVVFITGLVFWLYRNSSDERVSKALLSLMAQSLVSELIVIVLAKKQLERSKPGKDEVFSKALVDNQQMMLICAVLVLWLIVIVIHYLRSPQVKPTVPYQYDRQLNAHQSIQYSFCFVASLMCIIAPEAALGLYVKSGQIPFDSGLKLPIQLAGTFILAQSVFIINSMDFMEKEEQGKVFQANFLFKLIQLVMYVAHIFLLKTLSLMDALPVVVTLLIIMVNSALGLRRCGIVNLDRKDSKKRR
ncbi:uncharacterized protein LOC135502807 [Lineus longissimus]|uniref:uncharacterized protein LOC135502807 n=1 Tax=Lineus longissimus TaxID=88925 RepID=UPI002B4E4604